MEAARFPRTARLLLAADFAALRGASRRLACRHFHAEFKANDLATARLGLAVSKRVSKRAVQRNRLKRLARESFRHRLAHLPAVDILLIARPSALNITGADLLIDLATLWDRLSALLPPEPTGTMRA